MKDPRIEQWLDSYKLEWRYVEALPIESVIIDKEAKENIRLTERLDEDLVLRYGIALDNKAQFPGIVVFPMKGKGKEVLHGMINGWHRTEAFTIAERKTIPAYIVEVTDKLMITVLRRTANTLEGKPPTVHEMVEHAVYIVRQGYKITDAARLMSVSVKRLQDRVLYDEVKGRLASMGVDAEELGLPRSALSRLSQLRDRHLKALVLLAHEARLTGIEQEELARDIRQAQSDDDADQCIERVRQMNIDKIHRTQSGTVAEPSSPIRRLPVILRQAERLITNQRDRGFSLTPGQLKHLIGVCRKFRAELDAMIHHLEEVGARG